ncbi:type II toxin-antitoxin system HicB family antitoxin [Microcoleus sp. FACHB-68]|uniref:type II toxin-antitoxin system HicB family antitoxin n=1 Tax=Microcoleus sp. FACHB-68 TaxID=2692826 RepID=UPI001688E98A|nr:type II toxin-antitoxin system HicB family antitoxin [Microcoleus sp. FACHB-68]MBD1938220.1 type II toxin-antitoxin system HicB family antitoxin [Microcoleus sp. FACHB-68]
MQLHYTVVIHWSNEDNCYLVHLPDFPSQQFHTHGNTYEEALKNAQEVLELLVEEYQAEGKPLPEPKTIEQNVQFA